MSTKWIKSWTNRTFGRGAAIAAGAAIGVALSLGLCSVARAQGNGADPKPVPDATISNGGFYFPAPGNEPSLITDFDGHVGLSHLTGTVTHTDTTTGVVTHLPFDSDIRFMKGIYVGVDGQTHFGTFLFL